MFNRLILLALFIAPFSLSAGESSKGTVIMISGVSGWLLLSSAFVLWKELKRGRNANDGK
ncbi:MULTISPECIES: hypothetical protein [unclassified Lentimonas]|uniref:hypothetical protein n=1 Tax=unclassified Lentimonas TaxID=2630993 RepID=UPI001323DDD0|nr:MULTISPECIES: hypothetical protein [unclassified Lentimonas]CAA6690080.1 Unannotated [Lentimonas sp. CC19]CAA6690972.1 Unannotated [Lentimonas sp. CC10]CAA7070691.1 Unannotated [Lentimonas sp. CC11]